MKKYITILMLLALSSVAIAYGHTWMKMSETIVTNNYGNQVKQCVWQCGSYGHNNHTTVTQGISTAICPIPN